MGISIFKSLKGERTFPCGRIVRAKTSTSFCLGLELYHLDEATLVMLWKNQSYLSSHYLSAIYACHTCLYLSIFPICRLYTHIPYITAGISTFHLPIRGTQQSGETALDSNGIDSSLDLPSCVTWHE